MALQHRYPTKVLENLRGTDVVKKFPAFYGIHRILNERCRDGLKPEDQLYGEGLNI
jgi:hypothetical protein